MASEDIEMITQNLDAAAVAASLQAETVQEETTEKTMTDLKRQRTATTPGGVHRPWKRHENVGKEAQPDSDTEVPATDSPSVTRKRGNPPTQEEIDFFTKPSAPRPASRTLHSARTTIGVIPQPNFTPPTRDASTNATPRTGSTLPVSASAPPAARRQAPSQEGTKFTFVPKAHAEGVNEPIPVDPIPRFTPPCISRSSRRPTNWMNLPKDYELFELNALPNALEEPGTGGFPYNQGADSAFLRSLISPSDLAFYDEMKETKIFVYQPNGIDVNGTKMAVKKFIVALTDNDEISVAFPARSTTAHEKDPYPLIVSGLTSDQATTLCYLGCAGIPGTVCFFTPYEGLAHEIVMALTNYSLEATLRDERKVEVSVSGHLLRDPNILAFLRLNSSNLGPNISAEEARKAVADSVVARAQIWKEKNKEDVTLFYIYIKPPTTAPEKVNEWRRYLRSRKYPSKDGTGIPDRMPHCALCHSFDHPLSLCPYPSVTGWHASNPVGFFPRQDQVNPLSTGDKGGKKGNNSSKVKV
ncbi:hypothetical protein CVT26_012193 [Gymnopilus dilepis]|uniref:Uncharacterized protein n=1 Tax=Gymnopilus dilepis TaxID=231916 RepID=A0A409W9G1_9AGAR|nr:hypothetical protein CVT26_012193 [Gymnopilus dilepis]